MKMHDLKTHIWEFRATMFGNKSFELRNNDRDFHDGDYLILREWDPDRKEYTGAVLMRQITYILKGGSFGLPSNMVILSVIMV